MTRLDGLLFVALLVVLLFEVVLVLDARDLLVVPGLADDALLVDRWADVVLEAAVDARVFFWVSVVVWDLRLDVEPERPLGAVCFFAIQQPPFPII
ncbi:MAG: hypothetical protein JXA10_19795 [Anaerolineae bacterium]|nr:hypothetical protein [Anaerolineae bacterium]